MASAEYGSLPFQEQIDFYRSKVALPTESWTDIYAGEHDHVAVVAGANKMAIVEDFQKAIDDAITNGKTIEEFRKDFDQIVERHGWPYKGGRSWRTRVIYETNLRQSYAAGREVQMADPELRKARPYGLYRHGGSRDPRPEHLALDGTVLPLDDPWWDVWTPMNGWGCSCKKYTLSARDVERYGLTVLDEAPEIEWQDQTIGVRGPSPRTVRVPRGIDPGFEHRPGASRISSSTPVPLDEPVKGLPGRVFPDRPATQPLPAPRPFTGELLPEGLPAQEYAEAFLNEFGASIDQPVLFTDATGDALMISDALFKKPNGQWKADKRDRGQYMPLLAQALRDPDEIWVAVEWQRSANKPSVRRRYIAEFQIEGHDQPGIAVFEWGRSGWSGITTYQEDPESMGEIARYRNGVRLYQREP